MEPDNAYNRRAELAFVDVREPYEWDAGHIESAVHIPLQQILDRFTELDRKKSWVVVCQIGQRSELATQFLRTKGYEVDNLEGGLERWSAAGYPLVMTTGIGGSVVDGWAQDLVWEERGDPAES